MTIFHSRFHFKRWHVFAAIFSFFVSASSKSEGALTGLAWVDGHGHIDVEYAPVDPLFPLGPKEIDLHWHVGEGLGSTVLGLPAVFSQDFQPDELYAVIPLVSNSNFARPSGSIWDFTGAAAGAPLYVIPLMVPPAIEVLPRLGLASDTLTYSEWGNLNFTFSLLNPAPGQISIFDGNSTTPVPIFSSAVGSPVSFPQQAQGHYHHNYAFTAPGIYDLQLTVNGTHSMDGPKTATASFQFFVGAVPEPSSAWLLAIVGYAYSGVRRRVG